MNIRQATPRHAAARAAATLPFVVVLAASCASPRTVVTVAPQPMMPADRLAFAAPQRVGMDARLNVILDSLVRAGIEAGAAPGAALVVGRHGSIVHQNSYGRIDVPARAAAVTDSTKFDLASLTKVIAATTAAMILEEEGKLDLDRPVRDYLPELDAPDKAAITVHDILTHRAGFVPFAPLWRDTRGNAAYLSQINARPLAYAPRDSTVYSDFDLILTALIIERLSGQRLDAFLKQRVWDPLGMRDTGFNPLATTAVPDDAECTVVFREGDARLAHISATEIDTLFRRRLVHGIVHDENACALGGVAGHAGLFSSTRDLAVFAQMMLNGGEYNGVRILRPATIARWTARHGPRSSRAIGWDTPSRNSSAGRYFSPRSFGHTGFTGTSIWIDPERSVFVILLTNRVNPTRQNSRHEPLRRAVADAVQRAILDAPLREWLRGP